MAADRGAFIDQSQSLNLFIQNANFSKLSAAHFHAWKKGLKTGMYYLRTKAAADAIKFTVDQAALKKTGGEILGNEDQLVVDRAAPLTSQLTEEEKMAQLSCSLDNPEGCESCSG